MVLNNSLPRPMLRQLMKSWWKNDIITNSAELTTAWVDKAKIKDIIQYCNPCVVLIMKYCVMWVTWSRTSSNTCLTATDTNRIYILDNWLLVKNRTSTYLLTCRTTQTYMYHTVDNTNNNRHLLRSYISTQDIVLIIAIIYIKKNYF